ncbi:hypothetical protein GCM10012284_13500 [Mangrovihabitans endophyticus]|uniref:Uncharacterized protein n=1 Tax=Mangrovihabitans endophyticus TaxID=1751298 RepID=A0A8J3BY34_9ACTN|nr:hypothetical protein GCM10012284_13500 [Mangrovihabitans endophyticus]
MTGTVVLDAHTLLSVTHIEPISNNAAFVAHPYLRLRPGQSAIDKQQTKLAFLRALGTAVDQR